MIYVDVKGNLGNQLFIYAFARNLQEKTGQKICLNTTYLSKYFPDYTFSLDDYKLNENVYIESKKNLPFFMNIYMLPIKVIIRLFKKNPIINKKFSIRLFNFLAKRGYFLWLQETYINFKIRPHKNYYVTGFWQSPKYFDYFSEELKKELTPQKEVLAYNRDFFDLIRHKETICVTIRRGDYISNAKIKNSYYLCGPDFFYTGVKRLRDKYPDAIVICFSDDIEWVKTNLDFHCETYYESGNDPVWEKLRLMSACKHFVLSNSSFSWWAAYLSSRNGHVIAPSKWYVDNRQVDIYREGWEYIEV